LSAVGIRAAVVATVVAFTSIATAHAPSTTRRQQLTERLRAHPSDPDLLTRRARAFRMEGAVSLALADLEQALIAAPGHLSASLELARTYAAIGSPRSAIEILATVRSCAAVSLELARAHAALGQRAAAVAAYRDAIGHGATPTLILELAELQSSGDAIETLEAGVDALGGAVVLREALIEHLRAAGRHAEAIGQVDAILAKARLQARWLRLRGQIRADSGDAAGAARDRAAAASSKRAGRRGARDRTSLDGRRGAANDAPRPAGSGR